MSVVSTVANYWKYMLGKMLVDVSSDTFKIILMDDTFVFDPDNHATLSDVVSGSPCHELETGSGYTRQNEELTGGAWAEDDSGNQGIRTFDTVTWTASGGVIGPAGCAIIYDETVTAGSPASPVVVGCIDFGDDYEIPDGSSFQVVSPSISVGLASLPLMWY